MLQIVVSIGIIYHDGNVLICKRRPDAHLAGYWEFPGGKCLPGETPADCLLRELNEELAVSVAPIHAFTPIHFTYTDRAVTLHPFLCQLMTGHPTPLAADEIKWVRPATLHDYTFPPANTPLIQELIHHLSPAGGLSPES